MSPGVGMLLYANPDCTRFVRRFKLSLTATRRGARDARVQRLLELFVWTACGAFVTETGSSTQPGASPDDRPSHLASPALFLALAFALGVGLAGSRPASLYELFRLLPALLAAASFSLLAGALGCRAERHGFAAAATLAGFVLAGAAAAILF